jgi:hypothetical protein
MVAVAPVRAATIGLPVVYLHVVASFDEVVAFFEFKYL